MMNDELITRTAVMESLTAEYNRRGTGDGLKLAWIEKAVNDTPSAQPVAKDIDVPINDCISRAAAIDALDQIFDRCEEIEAHLPEGDPDRTGYKMYPDYMTVWKYLHQLPSAQPETAKRIVGKSRDGMTLWYQCDMCNEPVDVQDNFCRGCGRRLTDE